MRILKFIGYLLAALVAIIASYVFIFSGSFHTPTGVLTPAPYVSPGGPILVFGGTRATGLDIVRLLRERGEAVTVAVRSTSNTAELQTLGAQTVTADVLDADAVTAALASGAYRAVISTIGTSRGDNAKRPDFVGNRNIIDAAKAAGVRRFVFITVIGAGDSYDTAPLPARQALKEVIELKTQAENHLKVSGLDHTIIRPGGLGAGKATAKAFLTEDREAFSYISRKDLAALTVAALGDANTIGKTYAAYDPERRTLWKGFND